MLGNTSASGSVVNSGTISAAKGIVVQAATITGAIINGGAIVAKGDVFGKSDGIVVRGIATFLGGVSNRGSISAGHIGIEFGKSTTNAFGVSSVVGSIVNSGTITAKTGIALFESTISGAIVDSGSIKATSRGILIDSGSEILAGNMTAINIAGPTFTGGIINFGVISGSAGIEIKSAHAVSIFDAGAILAASGGTAIEFVGSGNTLTLGAGYTISGTVDPSGNNTFQLGGSGSDTFDLSSIGTQYLGFTTFNVVSGTWTVSSASTAHWAIKSGILEIASGELTSTTVSSGGVLVVESGGTASSSFVKAGGTEIIEPGAVVSGVSLVSGATVELVGGIPLPSGIAIPAGGILGIAGGVYSALPVSSGRTLKVLSGGTDLGAMVSGGGTLVVAAGGTDSGATILKGGVAKVTFGGIGIDTSISSGGTEIVSAGGVASDTSVSRGGALIVSSGGVADPTNIFSGGTETIRAGGTDDGARISGGGKLFVLSGGTAIDITIFSGGSAINSRGGDIEVVAGSTNSGVLVNSGAVNVNDGGALVLDAVTVTNAGTINLSGASGGSGAEIYVSGTVNLTGGGKVVLSPSGNNTIEAGGITNTLINVNNTITGAGTVGDVDLRLINSGRIEAPVSALTISSLVVNVGTMAATSGGVLRIAAGGTNTGTLNAASGSEIDLFGDFTNSKTIVASAGGIANLTSGIIINGTGGVILASGASAHVNLDGATIFGGTLKTSGTGAVIETISSGGGGVLDGSANSVTNLGTVLVNDDSALTLQGTIKNSGTIFVDNVNPSADVHLFIDTSGVTLQGGGKVQLSNEFCNFITGVSSVTSSVLLNVDNTISGQGVIGSSIADDEAGLLQVINGAKGVINGNGTFFIPLTIATPGKVVVNSGTLEGTNSVGLAIDSDVANSKIIGALGSGAKVTIEGTVTNISAGSILASGSGAHVDLNGAVVSGGTLKTSGNGAVIEALFATANTVSGVTIAGGSLVKITDGATLTISGTINNSGAIEVDPVAVSGALLVGSSSATLQGGGRVIMGGNDAFIRAVSSGATLINVKNTISGAGTIGAGDGHLTLVNSSGINANSGSLLTISTGNAVANAGILEAMSSGRLVIADSVNNAKLIEALGSGAKVTIENGSVIRNTTASAVIVASGKGAQVELDGATISGGLVEAMSGSTAIVSGGTVGASATVETLTGGTAIVNGVVANTGTFIASGAGSLLEITGGAVVSGGTVKVGNGIVDVLSGGTADIVFQSNGSGGLEIADTNANPSAFTGTVSGFGGVNHANHVQFIDLVSVTSAAHTISFSYTSSAGSGTLTVSSGGAVVASIELIGTYSSGNFHVTAGPGGTVKITDPTVANGGSVNAGQAPIFDAHRGIDLPDIAFGAHTTLAYTENAAGTGGTLTVSDGRHTAAIALLGNYMAGSFVAVADGHGGTLITEGQPEQPLVAHPRA